MDTIKAVKFFGELKFSSIKLLASAGQIVRMLETAWEGLELESKREQISFFNKMLCSSGLSTSLKFISSEARLIPVLRDPLERLNNCLQNPSEIRDKELISLHAQEIAAGLLRLRLFLELFSRELGFQPKSYLESNAEALKLAEETLEFPVYTGVEFDRLSPDAQQRTADVMIKLLELYDSVKRLRDYADQLDTTAFRPAPLHTAMAVAADVFSSTFLPEYEEIESGLAYNEAGFLITATFEEILGHYLLQGNPPQTADEQMELYDIPEFVATGLQRLYVLGQVAGWPFEALERIRLLAIRVPEDLRELSLRVPED